MSHSILRHLGLLELLVQESVGSIFRSLFAFSHGDQFAVYKAKVGEHPTQELESASFQLSDFEFTYLSTRWSFSRASFS